MSDTSAVVRTAWIGTLTAAVLVFNPVPASAITPGRAWAPVERLNEPGFAYLVAPRLDAGLDGVPVMAVSGFVASDKHDGLGYRWGGTAWVRTWTLGQSPLWLWPVLSPPGTSYLVWTDKCCLDFASITPQGSAQRETIATTSDYRTEYSAAVSPKRRWAVVHDSDYFQGEILRVFSSTALRSWRETRLGDLGYPGVALAPLDDTTAVLAAVAPGPSGEHGIGLWRVDDSGVAYTGLFTPGFNRPRFRPRPSGGLWLAWATSAPYIALTTYRSGALVSPDTVRSTYRSAPDWAYMSTTPDLSRDGGEYPALAWEADLQTGGSVLCVSVPTDQGFTLADEIPGAASGLPTVARDLNGDVWVGSWEYFDTANWTHTYTIATCSPPRLSGAGRARTVAWTLSEPAPETWWAVLRAVNGGAFESVARVRAGSSLEMSFADVSPAANLLAYKIRRECVDTRYAWESAVATLGAGSRPPIYLGPPIGAPWDAGGDTEPTGSGGERRMAGLQFSLSGAEAGPLAVRIYDLQGRVVLERAGTARGGRSRSNSI